MRCVYYVYYNMSVGWHAKECYTIRNAVYHFSTCKSTVDDLWVKEAGHVLL